MTKPTRKELIEKHRPVVARVVDAFLRLRPYLYHLRDDLISEGHIKLVVVADRFLAGEIDSFNAYLRLSIRTAIWDVVRSENVIQKPRYCSATRINGLEMDQLGQQAREDGVDGTDPLAAINLAMEDDSDRALLDQLQKKVPLPRIARRLDSSELEVRERAGQILRRLKRELNR